MAYAENTSVPVARSRDEIERTLKRYGATQFVYGYSEDDGRALIGFTVHARQVRFELPLPTVDEVSQTATGRRRKGEAAQTALEREERRRWRALALAIKAKLEVVETGITTFEEEFLAHIMTPDGSNIGQHVIPRLAGMYATGQMPRLLPAKLLPPGAP
jgi:hypothetical protein